MQTKADELKALIEAVAAQACEIMDSGCDRKTQDEVADLVYNHMLADPPPEMVDLLKEPDAPSPPSAAEPGGDGAIEGKYGVIRASKKEFHANEPVFLLRATDPFAVGAIYDYARQCEQAGCSPDHVNACMGHARRMLEWQKANPALVKKLPN